MTEQTVCESVSRTVDGMAAGMVTRVAVHAVDPIFEAGLRGLLNRDGVHVAERPAHADVSLVVADRLTAGLLAVAHAAAPGPDRPIIALVNGVHEGDIVELATLGLHGVLAPIDTGGDDLRTRLRAAATATGLPTLTVADRERFADGRHRNPFPESAGLTRREVEVLRLIAEGFDTRSIAARLGLTERTVKRQLFAIMQPRRLRTRAHAVAYAIRNRYI